jgi:hypothetical protein
VILGILVGHGVVVCGMILHHRPAVIVDFDRFLNVLVTDRPELGGFISVRVMLEAVICLC